MDGLESAYLGWGMWLFEEREIRGKGEAVKREMLGRGGSCAGFAFFLHSFESYLPCTLCIWPPDYSDLLSHGAN
jgi:hypothetical protein